MAKTQASDTVQPKKQKAGWRDDLRYELDGSRGGASFSIPMLSLASPGKHMPLSGIVRRYKGGETVTPPRVLLEQARELRRNMTDAEKCLWRAMRGTTLGVRFRRQAPIGPFIVDFVCLEKKLVVEVDGGQHADSALDRNRDAWLEREGFRVLRFWNHEVLGQLNAVLETIMRHVA